MERATQACELSRRLAVCKPMKSTPKHDVPSEGRGLANALRPGFSDPRTVSAAPKKQPPAKAKVDDTAKPKATPYGYDEPRPEPREQASDSLAHEQERSTGVSGHSGNS